MTRALRLLALAVLGLAAGLGPVVGLPGTAVAKSYDFPLVAVDARGAPDGSMLVTERRGGREGHPPAPRGLRRGDRPLAVAARVAAAGAGAGRGRPG